MGRKSPTESRWAIDTSDLQSVSEARRAMLAKLGSVGRHAEDQFAAEILIGELLVDEVTSTPQALTMEITHDATQTTLHVYSQNASRETDLRGLEKRLMSSCGLPIVADHSDQGLHIEVQFSRRRLWTKRPLRSLWEVACCVLAERAEQFSHRVKRQAERRRSDSLEKPGNRL